jgi:GDPmannose 4,6-dehydratase
VRRALITGAGGQDSWYLSRLLLAKGYEVVGLGRRRDPETEFDFREGDVCDETMLRALFAEVPFDEVYNLAGGSFGPSSWENPVETAEVHGVAVAALLEIIRNTGRPIRFFQASSSELFGEATESPQSETTPLLPISPYGAAKLFAHRIAGIYRRRYGLFACCGILFNHESPRRREEFVTRKVAKSVARIRAGLQSELRLGNLDVWRDWGFAGDTVEAMWRMLQADAPDDFVIATGERHSVRELCEIAFARGGLDYRDHVVSDPALIRSAEFDRLGDASKARRILGWAPRTPFREIIESMVDAELKVAAERAS